MTPAETPFELVVFDFDGTLSSSLEGIAACMTAALQSHGYAAPGVDDVKSTIGSTLEESIDRLTAFACSDMDLVEVVQTYRALHAREAAPRVRLFDGAEEVLAAIAAAGIEAALVSNKGSAGLRQLLEHSSIQSSFALVLSADDVSDRKPAAELYEAHIKPAFPGISRARTLIVGDTAVDLRFAANIRARSCWAAYGYGDAEVCAALNPDFRINTIRELAAVCGVTVSPR